MEKWIQKYIILFISVFSLLLQNVKGDMMANATDIHENTNVDVKPTVLFTSNSSTDIQMTNASIFSRNTSRDTNEQGSDHENSGMVVVYVTVPVAVVILSGTVLVSVLVIRRRKRQHQDKTMNSKSQSLESKKENNNEFGAVNEAFSDQLKKHPNGHFAVSSQYSEAEEKSNIYYEYDTNYTKNSENLYYDYNNRNTCVGDLVEDEFGYGLFKTQQTAQEHFKDISTVDSRKESDSSPIYINGAECSDTSKQTTRKETNSRTLSVDDEDPLYDHAKAGGHEWESKSRDTCLYVNEENINQKNVYANSENTDSPNKYLASDDVGNGDIDINLETVKTPVYLELEAEEEYNKITDYKQFQDTKEKIPIANNEYDYAFVNGTNNDTTVDETKTASYADSTEDSNSLRQYFILEKENVIHVEDNEYDSTPNHEYFILEKVER